MRRMHRPLIVTAWLMLPIALVSVAGLLLDDRILTGVPIWIKPLKFAISIAVYSVTLAWLLSLLTRGRRTGWWLGTVVSAALIGEMVVIVGQVVRGRTSHFNVATALDATLFAVMGATIMTLWVATAGIGALLLRQRIADRAAALAVRLGLLIALAGMAVGFLMTQPTAAQRAAMSTTPPTVIGAHSVGVPDGGPGLPLVGWSTTGGDLRIGHFIGMHALQALPLLVFALGILARRFPVLGEATTRWRLVLAAAVGWAGSTGLVTWQALRGQPLLQPDGLTLLAAVGTLAATAAITGWALIRRRPEPAAAPAATAVPV